jgi:hypothetical protein
MLVRSLLMTTAALALAATTATAQKVLDKQVGGGGSPHETVEWNIQGAKITLAYGRPYLKARNVLDVAPVGKIWRTGADAATTLTTDKTLMIGSLMIPPGTYTLYTVPGEKKWQLVVSKQTGQWGTEYNADRDLGRTDLSVSTAPAPAEQVTIGFADSAFTIDWGTVRASAPFMVH